VGGARASSSLSTALLAIRESVIREMTRLAEASGAINLAQGFPDFDAPQEVKRAAIRAIRHGSNQYSFTWGSAELRAAIAEKARRYNGLDADPDENVTVTCGSTEAVFASILALANPGDEFIVVEPFYENYVPAVLIARARPRSVELRGEAFSLEEEELKAAFGPATKAIVVNTPHNPTGRVLTRQELKLIADLCEDHDVLAITDEIYEHILYGEARHISLATIGSMWERTITVSGISKTYSATGWRVGYAIAPKHLTQALRKVHDYLTVCAPSPLQEAAVRALALPEDYYASLRLFYARRRQEMLRALKRAGFRFFPPEGAYYVFADFSGLSGEDDEAFSARLIREAGVAAVPGSSFYLDKGRGRKRVRFAFCKRRSTLLEASRRLLGFASRLTRGA
jgi:aspartate/methionine/tyrosine aminotransferase